MAFQGAYGNAPPVQAGGNWYEILTKLLSGLKGAGQGIGRGIGAAGQGTGSGLASVGRGAQLPEILKILGSIGKGVGQTATMVGRQLPYAGPLVQAGEYGILNAVGKQDSPWAQGNAFIQRDVRNEQENKLQELMRQIKGQEIDRNKQVIEQGNYDVTQRPMAEKTATADLEAKINQAKANGLDVSVQELKLQQIKKEINDTEASEKIWGPNEKATFAKDKAKKDLQALDAEIAQRYSYASWNENRGSIIKPPMTASQIDANARKWADTHTLGMSPGLDPPMQDKAVFEEWQRNVKLYKQSVAQGIDIDTGLPYAGGTQLGGGAAVLGELGKKVPSGATVIPTAKSNANAISPGDTANIPFGQLMDSLTKLGGTKWEDVPTFTSPGVDEQVNNLEIAFARSGLDLETFLSQVISRGQLDPTLPDDAEVIKMFMDKYGAK